MTPEILGVLGHCPEAAQDTASVAYQMSLLARSQSELARTRREAEAQGKRLATLSLTAEVRFASAQQRQQFGLALQRAIVDVVGRWSAPAAVQGRPAGRPFRLVVACHPVPKETP